MSTKICKYVFKQKSSKALKYSLASMPGGVGDEEDHEDEDEYDTDNKDDVDEGDGDIFV